jgi:fatty acid desaturase
MRLDQGSTAPRASAPKGGWREYTQLSRQVRQAGLLERRRGWYAARIGLNLALLAAGWAAFLIIGSSWWQLVFVRRQVLTSRNVRGSRLVDLVLGGLNYQIEHHLFPTMARPNLRHAQPLVRAFCQDHGLGYTEAGLFGSYAQALRHLHTVGAPLRPAVAE